MSEWDYLAGKKERKKRKSCACKHKNIRNKIMMSISWKTIDERNDEKKQKNKKNKNMKINKMRN